MISPIDIRQFYGFLRVAKSIKDRGFDINIDKSKIFDSLHINSRDGKFNENNEEIVRFMNKNRHTNEDYLMSLTREAMSKQLKQHGFAKVGSSSRYDIVVNETKKNAVFSISDPVQMYNFLSSCNSKLQREDRDKNEKFFQYFQEINSQNVFSHHFFNTTTYSKISNLNREFVVTMPNGTGTQRAILRYCYGKFKFYIYSYDPNDCASRAETFFNMIDKYVECKIKSKEVFFHTNEKSTSLYDLLFLPGPETVEVANNGDRLQITL